jgi:hypothetical protein
MPQTTDQSRARDYFLFELRAQIQAAWVPGSPPPVAHVACIHRFADMVRELAASPLSVENYTNWSWSGAPLVASRDVPHMTAIIKSPDDAPLVRVSIRVQDGVYYVKSEPAKIC